MHCASAGGGGPLVVGRLSSSDQRLLPARDSPFQPLIQVLSYRILSFLSLFFFWQNPPICKFPCHSQNSLKDLHFVIFMLVQPWVWATENYFSFIIPQFWCFNLIFLWCNLQLDKCEEYYCTLGIPTTDSTSSKSFLCNFGQIFLLINLNWTQCAFQSWDLFLGKYFNYSNITLPNPVGNENSIVLGILRTDCVLALIFQTLVQQIWAG